MSTPLRMTPLEESRDQTYMMKEMINVLKPGNPSLNMRGIMGNYQTAFFPYPAVNVDFNKMLAGNVVNK